MIIKSDSILESIFYKRKIFFISIAVVVLIIFGGIFLSQSQNSKKYEQVIAMLNGKFTQPTEAIDANLEQLKALKYATKDSKNIKDKYLKDIVEIQNILTTSQVNKAYKPEKLLNSYSLISSYATGNLDNLTNSDDIALLLNSVE